MAKILSKQFFAIFAIGFISTCSFFSAYAANEGSASIKLDSAIANKSVISASTYNKLSVGSTINCDYNCQAHIQSLLDQYRIAYRIPAMSMSLSSSLLSLPSTYHFYSGTTIKNGIIPITGNNLFEIGSITKTYTAVMILQLQAEGLLGDFKTTTIGQWFPQYPAWGTMTIEQLLNHTAGTYDYADSDLLAITFKNPAHYFSTDFLLDWGYGNIYLPFHLPTTFTPPGSQFSYSNTNYILLSRIIELVTNKSYQANLEDRIFKPLGMIYASYNIMRIPISIANMTRGYNYIQDPLHAFDITNQSLSWGQAAGGIISTTEDQLKFMRALFTGKLLPPTQFAEMQQLVCASGTSCASGHSIPPNTTNVGCGLGIFNTALLSTIGPYWFHNGTTSGFRDIYYYFPDYDFYITIFSDTRDASDDPHDIYFMGLVQAIGNYLFVSK